MNDFSQPPIPSPYSSGNFAPPSMRGNWQSAPSIVKGWAYPLTWLGITMLPLALLAIIASQFMDRSSGAITVVYSALWPTLILAHIAVPTFVPESEWTVIIIFITLLTADIWLNRALKNGTSAAWAVQMAPSILGLFCFPIGTLIHGYLLSQWFKPETKAWFGVQ